MTSKTHTTIAPGRYHPPSCSIFHNVLCWVAIFKPSMLTRALPRRRTTPLCSRLSSLPQTLLFGSLFLFHTPCRNEKKELEASCGQKGQSIIVLFIYFFESRRCRNPPFVAIYGGRTHRTKPQTAFIPYSIHLVQSMHSLFLREKA